MTSIVRRARAHIVGLPQGGKRRRTLRERNDRRAITTMAGFWVGASMMLASILRLDARAGEYPPLPPVRPPASSSAAEPQGGAPPPPPEAPQAPQPTETAACLAELRANEVEAQIVPAPPAPSDVCGVAEPVRVTSIGLADRAKIDLPDRPILDCPFALVFSGFARDLMAPLATAILGSRVSAVGTGPGYDCRSPIRLPSGNPNPHGEGIAVDVAQITLADRRRIAIGHEAKPAEVLFVKTMRKAACGWFTTVLGPGSNAAHAEHFHFDILHHDGSDNYRICE
jgi:hypothetical protein